MASVPTTKLGIKTILGGMATIYKNVGEQIRKLRKNAGFSQFQLAEKSKMDLTSISEIESGLRNPSLKTLHKIANALRIPIKDLF